MTLVACITGAFSAKRGERVVLRETRDETFLAHINLLALHPRHISERNFISTTEISERRTVAPVILNY